MIEDSALKDSYPSIDFETSYISRAFVDGKFFAKIKIEHFYNKFRFSVYTDYDEEGTRNLWATSGINYTYNTAQEALDAARQIIYKYNTRSNQ